MRFRKKIRGFLNLNKETLPGLLLGGTLSNLPFQKNCSKSASVHQKILILIIL